MQRQLVQAQKTIEWIKSERKEEAARQDQTTFSLLEENTELLGLNAQLKRAKEAETTKFNEAERHFKQLKEAYDKNKLREDELKDKVKLLESELKTKVDDLSFERQQKDQLLRSDKEKAARIKFLEEELEAERAQREGMIAEERAQAITEF